VDESDHLAGVGLIQRVRSCDVLNLIRVYLHDPHLSSFLQKDFLLIGVSGVELAVGSEAGEVAVILE